MSKRFKPALARQVPQIGVLPDTGPQFLGQLGRFGSIRQLLGLAAFFGMLALELRMMISLTPAYLCVLLIITLLWLVFSSNGILFLFAILCHGAWMTYMDIPFPLLGLFLGTVLANPARWWGVENPFKLFTCIFVGLVHLAFWMIVIEIWKYFQ